MNELPFCVVLEDDEVLFSMVARCKARYGAIGQEAIIRRLTGQRRIHPLLSAIPSFVAQIAERVPTGNPLADPTSTIQKHTPVPYFTSFLESERAQAAIEGLASGHNAHDVFMSLGLAMYRCGSAPIHPRWCVSCNRKSESERGFAIYRTDHQLPGVTTCWIHGEVLCKGCEQCGPNPVRNWGLDLPERCRCGRTVRPLQVLKELPGNIAAHNWLARESAYLLTGAVAMGGISVHRLRTLLGNHGFLSGTLTNTKAIAAALEHRFGTDFLTWLGYPGWTGNRPSHWIRDLLTPSRSGRTRATIQYLLFAGIVADSVRSFAEEISTT